MTEAEYKFADKTHATKAKNEINKVFKTLPAFLFAGKRIATLMPKSYETTGSRGIVRPDYHYDAAFVLSPVSDLTYGLIHLIHK
jgi:hypothetical protein